MADISKIKAEIKEWQRAYRRENGRDPGKEALRNNPEMQAKYKIWQDSLKADKHKSDDGARTPPKRAPKSIVPKKMPVQSASKGPSTPFSARKKAARLDESPAIPALNLSAAKPRATPTMIPFNSASSTRHGFSQSILDSDSDDNPFAGPGPASPTGSRSRRSSQLISPTKSMMYRQQPSSTFSTPQKPRTRMDLSPQGAMTPRTKARKRMRGEEVPATPNDKRRKLVSGGQALPRRLGPDDEDDDEEILDSPRKKSALGANGRVFTSMFDDASSGKDEVESLRSTPPPPPSESGDSYAPDWEGAHDSEDEPAPAPRAKSIFPNAPSQWTQDTWDAPAPGTDLSHLKRGIAGGKDPKKPKPNQDAKKGKDKVAPALSNPFELLPPMPGEETSKSGRQYDGGGPKGRGKGKKDKGAVEVDGDDPSDGDEGEVNEVEWRPHGPLLAGATSSQNSMPRTQTTVRDDDDDVEDEKDPAADLPSDLRTLLSIQSTRREDIKADSLVRDVLAGRAKRVGDVWGIGDVGSNDEGDDYERDDWDSEPEGWTGGVEM